MHLSGLEIHGFKSFPNRTKLTFAPGVMAIVGPNGCGKTNLVDAVRWVLGEQRSAILRSEKMEHVIFAGSLRQKPAPHAEVTLILENDRGLLPEEYTELAITRRLSRDGESEYQINRRPSRLRDIRNLFADTGLGPESYSIIELKMVETILSARTEERRRLFEEAAGVTGYKSRLKTTRARLLETRSDLVRLADLLNEVTTRRNSLKRQVARAKRFRHLRDALRVLELTAGAVEIDDLRARIAPMEQVLEADRAKRDELAKLLLRDERSYHQLHGRLTAMEETLQSLGAEKSQAEDRLGAARREIDVLEERIRAGKSRGEQCDREEVELAARLEDITAQLHKMEGEEDRAAERTREIEQRLDVMRETWEELQGRSQSHGQHRDNAERGRVKAEREQARAEGELRRAEERLREIESRMKQDTPSALPEAPSAPDKARAGLLKAQRGLDDAEKNLQLAREQEEATRARLAGIERNAAEIAADAKSAEDRVQFLGGIVKDGSGRPDAVKALLSSGIDGLAGRLGDAVVVRDEGMRAAVAAALEPLAEAVAVSAGSLETAVELLLKRERGRASLAVASAADDSAAAVFSDKRIAPLLQSVELRGNASGAARAFLARYGLVESLQLFLELAPVVRGKHGLVTHDGCALHLDGTITAGPSQADDLGAQGLLEGAETVRNGLIRACEAIETELAAARTAVDKARAARERSQAEHNQTRDKLRAADTSLRSAEAAWREYEIARTRIESETARLLEDRETLAGRMAELRAGLESAAGALAEVSAVYDEIRQQGEDLARESETLRAARDQLREKQVEARSTHARLRGEISRHQALREEYDHQLERLKQERTTAGGALEDAAEHLRRIKAEAARIEREVAAKAAELNSQRREYESIQKQRAESEGLLSQRRAEQMRISDRIHGGELERQDLLHRMNAVRDRILESYEMDLLKVRREELPLAVEEDNPFLEAPLGELREQLRDFGPINQVALEEYEVVDRRWRQLSEQNTDLERAVAVLEETIREINNVARKRFLDTFARVEGHFVGLFGRLFGGGEAALSLAEGDPLEAGIQIYASPRGKKLASIDLMSGGEKAMTAIALLFALYLERPSPFCFLDEVDAPLDDVNVVRFNRLLREFTDRTQFLVVTHNKLTMERADRLYGVTMEEEGVSRLVAVEIGRAEREEVQA